MDVSSREFNEREDIGLMRDGSDSAGDDNTSGKVTGTDVSSMMVIGTRRR